MKKIFSVSVFLFSAIGFSQNFTLKGIILDKNDKKPLEAATIHTENPQDSSLVAYSISDKNGYFKISGNSKSAELNVFVSFVGYTSMQKKIRIDKKEIDLGTFWLEQAVQELAGVEVTAIKPPITIKKDTLEFNADSFKTLPDASVEDLLKKLPGVEIDSDGTIKINGKSVTEVLVNGKPFFGNDPKIATKNLTKEMVSKIQVSDYKTKDEKFLGKQGDSQDKTLNIQLKEDSNKGHFGRVTAGYGTNNRYEANGMLNYFNDETKISVLANSNNINSSGFSMGEIFDMYGSFDWQQDTKGLVTTHSGGANYVDEWSEMVEVSGNYFYKNRQQENKSKEQREYFLPNRHYFTNSEYSGKNEQRGHEAETDLEFNPSKTLKIRVEPSFNHTIDNSNGYSSQASFDENQQLINQSEIFRRGESIGTNFSNMLNISKKFNEKGTGFRFSFRNNNSLNDSENFFNNSRTIQSVGSTTERQRSNTHSRSDNYRISLNFRQPIVEKLFVETDYTINYQQQKNQKDTYNTDAFGNFTIFNTPLSSNFETQSEQQTLQLGLSLEKEKYRARVKSGVIFSNLANEDFLQQIDFEKNYKNLFLQTHFNYRPSQSMSVSVDYSTEVNNPSVRQLQPIADISNPLHTFQGNPHLNPEFRQRLTMWFFISNQEKISVNSSLTASWTDNKIVSLTTTDSNLIRQTTYTNVGGHYDLWSRIGVSKTHRFDKNMLRYGISASYSTGQSQQFSNGVLFKNTRNILIPNLGISYSTDQTLSAELWYNLRWASNHYNISSIENKSVVSHSINSETNITLFKKLTLSNAFEYRYNPDIVNNFSKSVFFWNASAEYKLLKDKALLRLKVYDLLGQNNNASRVVSQDYIQESETLILQQYFMLSFTYKLGNFAKKSNNPPMRPIRF